MNAVAYARYSSDNQREESIDAQLRAIREYAKNKGMIIIAEYKDEAKSATTDARPEFQRMIADSARKEFEAVIVHKLDRFSRDRYDSAHYKRILKINGARIVSVLENLDDSPESIILESVLEGMAEYYSRNLARESMKGLKENAYQCKHTEGVPPLGYDVLPDKTYAVNQHEAMAVQIIFNGYADGKGYSEILRELQGYRTKRGSQFGKNSISDILRNEKYTGTFIFNRTESKIGGKRNGHKCKPDDKIIKIVDGMPRLISDETWARAQLRLKDNVRQGQYKAKRVYILSGKLYCGKCGAAYVGRVVTSGRGKKQYGHYMCGNRERKKGCDAERISKEYIENLVVNAVCNELESYAEIMAEDTYQFQLRELKELPEAAKKNAVELKKVRDQIQSIVTAIQSGAYHPAMNERLQELSALEARLKEYKHPNLVIIPKDKILEHLRSFGDFRNESDEVKRRSINMLVDKVWIYDDRCEIDIGGKLFYIRLDNHMLHHLNVKLMVWL